MKFAVEFLFMALFAIAAAQPLNQNSNDADDVAPAQPLNRNSNDTDDELITLLGRIITEPITLPCKLVKEAHAKLQDPEYKPSSLLGHVIKGVHDVCDGILVVIIGNRKKKEKKAAQPLIIKDLVGKIKDKLDDEDHEPITVVGKLVKKVHNKLNDEDYEPLTLPGKVIKKVHDAVDERIDGIKESIHDAADGIIDEVTGKKKKGKKAAQPLIIKDLVDKVKDKLDDEDFKPITLQGKLIKKAHEKLNDKDYEPLTLQGKVIKKAHDALNEKDEKKN